MNGRKQQHAMQPSRVMAVFQEAALSFNLPREATLGELAEELNALGKIYGGMPLYVDIRLPA
jgi:hypothetical protein